MKHFFLSISLFIFLNLSTYAQRSIQSTVFDSKNGQPIEMGNVRLLRITDSTLVQGCQTDIQGNFKLNKIKSGSYTLLITNVGFFDYYKNITVENKDIILKAIQLTENAKMLGEVEIRGTAAQMVVKGDTLEYNANAFKTTQNAVVEDLLKRLPGVEVSTDGKITVNGEEVKKIRVNGKKFFGDDAEMATKNIPAELIDKIQVLDQKSDMALLTGFEDNDTERIINLTFKPNRKKGTFGNITGGAGMDTDKNFRYDNNLFLNFINGEAQTTVTGGTNNTNTSRSSRGRSGGGYGGINSGINTTQNIGINNNTIVNPNLKIGGDGSLNHTFNDTESNSNQQTYLKDSIYTNNSKTVSTNENYSANLRLEVELKMDSLNTIVFQPNISYNQNYSTSFRDYLYKTEADSTSWGTTDNSGNGTSINGGLGIIFSHKFLSKKGRTFTTNFQTGISQSNNESFNKSQKFTPADTMYINQRTTNITDKYNYSLRMSYVEPLWNLKNFLETSVSFSETYNSSNKTQYDALKNDSINYDYSNNFENRFYSEALELNYRYVDKSYNIMMGIKGEPSQMYSTRIYANGITTPISKEVFNFSPTARLQYNFGKKKFSRLDYRGQTDQPSISQMQPVKNNTNLMNETVGNVELKPSFTQSLRLMYSTFNDKTFSSFNTYFRGQFTKNALVSNSIYDKTGKQYNQTVNAENLPFSLNGNVMFNTPIIQKRLHFNTNTSGGFDQRYGYSSKGSSVELIDVDNLSRGTLSNTGRYNAGEQISLTFTHDLIEIGARGSVRYSNTKNNLNPIISETYDWSGGGNLILHLPYTFNIGSDLNYTTMQGYSSSDQNQLIWNASFDKTVFNSKGVISLKINDLLRQQLNVRQSIGDNYIQYNTYNTLTSYFILSFTYKINKFAGSKNNPAEMNPENRFGPDNHPPRGDGHRGGGGHWGGNH